MPESPCRRARCLCLAFVAQGKGESNSDDERNGKEHAGVILPTSAKVIVLRSPHSAVLTAR